MSSALVGGSTFGVDGRGGTSPWAAPSETFESPGAGTSLTQPFMGGGRNHYRTAGHFIHVLHMYAEVHVVPAPVQAATAACHAVAVLLVSISCDENIMIKFTFGLAV